ncbi:MAG: hypothetical protein AAGA28_19610, partial [Pseudomonadota bacterium]
MRPECFAKGGVFGIALIFEGLKLVRRDRPLLAIAIERETAASHADWPLAQIPAVAPRMNPRAAFAFGT